jgi:hypothetical protein
MRSCSAAWLLLGAFGGAAWGATYTVTNADDSGPGSLRWAIGQANRSLGPDTITFDGALRGRPIRPLTELPLLTDPQTTIDGDLAGDGVPDVMLSGVRMATDTGSGLSVCAAGCAVAGLAIGGFPEQGIRLENAAGAVIRSCHVGLDLSGMAGAPNGTHDIFAQFSDEMTIGGPNPTDRNVLYGGSAEGIFRYGIVLRGCSRNRIAGNIIGLRREGLRDSGYGWGGLSLQGYQSWACAGNVIGGTTSGERNVLGGLYSAIDLDHADSNRIMGNYIGLAADGETPRPILNWGIHLWASAGNLIGGSTFRARNVFVDCAYGISIGGAEGPPNVIQGNYFGCNAAGTAQLPFGTGVEAYQGDPQVIGGGTPAAGNYFLSQTLARFEVQGVHISSGEGRWLVQHNRFGVLPSGRQVEGLDWGVRVADTRVGVTDNRFGPATQAILAEGTAALSAHRNVFRRSVEGVALAGSAQANLGNLSNSLPDDDGANVFGISLSVFIANRTANAVKAEGNWFGTTSSAQIDAKIYDGNDAHGLGLVDYDPLKGGVHPTGGGIAALRITGAAVMPTGAGAEISFSLSAPAEVTVAVLNLAGRTIAVPARAEAMPAGMQRRVWNRRAATGTLAPPGRYIVRITAAAADGQQANALCTLVVH